MGREIVLRTNLSPDNALERLRDSVSPWPEWWQIFVNWHLLDEPDEEYIGAMNGNSFKISILWHGAGLTRGPSIYKLKGRILPDGAGEGSLIRARLTEYPWLLAMSILVLIVFFAARIDLVVQVAARIAAVMGVVWSLFALIIRSLYSGDDQGIIGFLEKTLEAREVEKPTESSGIARG